MRGLTHSGFHDHVSAVKLELTSRQARQIALAHRCSGCAIRSDRPAHLRRAIDRLGLFQIDGVNVVTRAHYLPGLVAAGEL